jgi:hypothetical protein
LPLLRLLVLEPVLKVLKSQSTFSRPLHNVEVPAQLLVVQEISLALLVQVLLEPEPPLVD